MEKIEQVARAILSKVPTGYGMTASEAEDYARAAIEAMRKPTEAMKESGETALSANGIGDIEPDDSEVCFTAMIDAALKEGAE